MAWFLCPYRRQSDVPFPARECAMNQFTDLIRADGGDWSETEVLGDAAIVKVRASAATLAGINATAGFTRLPKDLLDDPLSSLTNTQKTALRDLIESLGYPRAEWQAALGTNLGERTLREVVRFIATRRRKPRYDQATDTIILDGPVQACRSIDEVDGVISA